MSVLLSQLVLSSASPAASTVHSQKKKKECGADLTGHRMQQAELGTREAAFPLSTANASFALCPSVRPEPCRPILVHLLN